MTEMEHTQSNNNGKCNDNCNQIYNDTTPRKAEGDDNGQAEGDENRYIDSHDVYY